MSRRLVVPLGLMLLLAGCSSEPSSAPSASLPAAPVSSAAGFAPSVDASATEDEPGTVACGALAAAINDGTLMNPGMVDAIVAASGTADAPIADAAKRLAASYAKATAAVGTEDEPDAVADVSAVAADMSEVCGESGLDTVG